MTAVQVESAPRVPWKVPVTGLNHLGLSGIKIYIYLNLITALHTAETCYQNEERWEKQGVISHCDVKSLVGIITISHS